MSAIPTDLVIEQGSTYRLQFTWCEDDNGAPGAPIDLTGTEIRMQIRKSQQTTVLVEALSTGASPFITHNGVLGTITVVIPPESTNLLVNKTALYDLEVKYPSGDVYRVIQGTVSVSPNITQLVGEPVVGS